MPDYFCGQCNRRTFRAGLCDECQKHRNLLESSADAAFYASRAAATEIEERTKKAKKDEDLLNNQLRVDSLTRFANKIEDLQQNKPNSLSQRIDILGVIANQIGTLAPQDWCLLSQNFPFIIDTLYLRIRLAVTEVLRVIQEQDPPLPETILPIAKVVEQSLKYEDINQMREMVIRTIREEKIKRDVLQAEAKKARQPKFLVMQAWAAILVLSLPVGFFLGAICLAAVNLVVKVEREFSVYASAAIGAIPPGIVYLLGKRKGIF